MDLKARKMGAGVIVHDSRGEVLATLSSAKALITDPIVAEAIAALQAVSFIQDLGFSNVVF